MKYVILNSRISPSYHTYCLRLIRILDNGEYNVISETCYGDMSYFNRPNEHKSLNESLRELELNDIDNIEIYDCGEFSVSCIDLLHSLIKSNSF